ncbi:hypothetical protein NW754_015190 [Fusarium falciforme]|nr:hypothetical protein NW754_015190 [Fusarium falciforme]
MRFSFHRSTVPGPQQMEDGGPVEGQHWEASRYSTQGAYGLRTCHDSEDAVADVVFVHGLTGDRETTWTDSSSRVFWPAQFLKNDVPKTRIVTFGYDADVVHFWAMASQNRIRNHALNLVNALAQLRERTETEARPILFVTHSLGGLVFEDAMVASRNSAEAHLQRISASTYGVCFLGTPHCGSILANWASVVGKMTKIVKNTNTSILQVLRPESEVLARIQTDFHNMVRSRQDQGQPALRITCFYEELPVRNVGEIVPKHYAILPAYNSKGIHDNHMGMTKFSTAQDQGYLDISTEIWRWARQIQRSLGSTPPPEHPGSSTLPELAGRPAPHVPSRPQAEMAWERPPQRQTVPTLSSPPPQQLQLAGNVMKRKTYTWKTISCHISSALLEERRSLVVGIHSTQAQEESAAETDRIPTAQAVHGIYAEAWAKYCQVTADGDDDDDVDINTSSPSLLRSALLEELPSWMTTRRRLPPKNS